MLAADAFIGGDSGPSHVFAMLCADKPQLAIYPDMGRDRRRHSKLQRELGLDLAWNSCPKRTELTMLTLTPSHEWVRKRWYPQPMRIGRFDAREAAALLLQAMGGSSALTASDRLR